MITADAETNDALVSARVIDSDAKPNDFICEPLDAKSTFVFIKPPDTTNSADADAKPASLLLTANDELVSALVIDSDAKPNDFTCEPDEAKSTLSDIKDADDTNSADADANTNDELNFENTCEPLAANEADDLASDDERNNDSVANNIEAVFCPTPSNTVLIDEVSAFKEPVVRSISSARNISEAVCVPTKLNLVLNEPVESPNDFVTLAKTIDDDNIAPAPNSDADATAPSPNKDAEAIAPPENSFANFEPESAAPNEKSFNEPVCSLVNSKLAVT